MKQIDKISLSLMVLCAVPITCWPDKETDSGAARQAAQILRIPVLSTCEGNLVEYTAHYEKTGLELKLHRFDKPVPFALDVVGYAELIAWNDGQTTIAQSIVDTLYAACFPTSFVTIPRDTKDLEKALDHVLADLRRSGVESVHVSMKDDTILLHYSEHR